MKLVLNFFHTIILYHCTRKFSYYNLWYMTLYFSFFFLIYILRAILGMHSSLCISLSSHEEKWIKIFLKKKKKYEEFASWQIMIGQFGGIHVNTFYILTDGWNIFSWSWSFNFEVAKSHLLQAYWSSSTFSLLKAIMEIFIVIPIN